MAKRRVYSKKRYSLRTLLHEREYGFYWYAWLWGLFRPMVIFLCALLIVAGITVNASDYVYGHFFKPMIPGEQTTVTFEIKSGASVTAIANDLVEQGILRNKGVFKYMVMFQGVTSKIHYGTYQVSPGMTAGEIISVLTAGTSSAERTITIIPGWNCEEIAEYLYRVGAIASEQEFLTLCNDTITFQNYYVLQQAAAAHALQGRKYALEGYFAPDTYRVFTTASATELVKTLLDQTDTVLNGVYNVDKAASAYDTTLTQDQTIILASMIEEEGRQISDYAKMSAVFHNRLNAGMRLESDPTVKYVLGLTNYVLTAEQLAVNSPYNTYLNNGLPPGPICNPSKAALQAALYPDDTYIKEGYLYFCSQGPDSKELTFSKTLEEHQAAVAMYRPLWQAYDDAQAAAAKAAS